MIFFQRPLPPKHLCYFSITRWDKLNTVQISVHTQIRPLHNAQKKVSTTVHNYLANKKHFVPFPLSPCSPVEHYSKDLIFAQVPRAPDVSLEHFIACKQWNYCSFPSLVSTSWFPNICNSVSCLLPPPFYPQSNTECPDILGAINFLPKGKPLLYRRQLLLELHLATYLFSSLVISLHLKICVFHPKTNYLSNQEVQCLPIIISHVAIIQSCDNFVTCR